ncbi:MAG: hypothetical protein HQM13_12915 [SAR324 cluster bacterium]|nr:hypothetical protein [SAR324 cluster bacterium]
MGRLTDLLNQKGMLDEVKGLNPENQASADSQILHLSEKFRKENLIDEIKEALAEYSSKGMNKKQVFQKLPTLGEFYIPASMNGRVIECSDASFQRINQENVVSAKAFSFNGHEIKYIFYDPVDATLQKGKFEEFPRDSYGKSMGQVGLKKNILCWIKKNFKHV